MRTPIFVAVSDIHLNEWKKYSVNNSRLKNGIDVIRVTCNKAKELNVPIFFAGDLIHNQKSVTQEVIKQFERAYKKYISGTAFTCIDGNHDQALKNTFEKRTPGYTELFSINKPQFRNINFKVREFPMQNMLVAGIPYLTRGQGFNDAKEYLEEEVKGSKYKKILMIHTDLPGAKTPEGIELKEYEGINANLDKYFKHWNLVISGHIHLPQKLSSKVYMLGSPQHQTISDAGTDMGYWIGYSDMTMEFKALSQYPQFIYYDEGDEPRDSINFWLKRPKQDEEEQEVTKVFNNKMTRKSLAKKYCKATGQNKKSKINYLTQILNSVE